MRGGRSPRVSPVLFPLLPDRPVRPPLTGVAAQSSRTDSSPACPAEEPMQLGCARLTPEERLRWIRAGECLYCGKPGHFFPTSDLSKRRGLSVDVGVLMSQTAINQSPSLFRMQLQVSICVGRVSLSLLALIDSGAQANLLDTQLAQQLGCAISTAVKPSNQGELCTF